jgi:two-component system nitrate/nitrite response regulator NarL
MLNGSPVDVVLLDSDPAAQHGYDFIGAARHGGYKGRFLIVTGSADVQDAATALRLGATGIFLKSETPDRLVEAIRFVGNGGVWIDQRVIQSFADELIHYRPRPEDRKARGLLEDQEHHVLMGILEGSSNREIGDGMGLSESKVKNIVQRLFSKADVRTRGQLVRAALEGSLGDVPEFTKRPPNEGPQEALLRGSAIR